jgi:CubicO group peptidase (beta-lactamase class C family)
MMNRLLLALLALTVLASPAAAQDAAACGTPAVIDDGWATAKPDDVGLDGARLCGLDKFLEQWPNANIHSVTVARRGKLVFERYFTGQDERWGTPLGEVKFGPETLHDLRSVTKSIVGLLYGIALDRGLVPPPDAPLLAQFPKYSDLPADPRRAQLTVLHALNMTLGMDWDEQRSYADLENSERTMEDAPDRNRFILDRSFVAAPGERWIYSGGAVALVGGLIAKGSGMTLHDFARQALFQRHRVARQPQQFQRQLQSGRRVAEYRLQGCLREFGSVMPQRGDNLLDAILSEQDIDERLLRGDRRNRIRRGVVVDDRANVGSGRMSGSLRQRLTQHRQLI